uniref:Uncharacterized protein n=1 Tax=viral metagenome TaxID=1070528 RepID=A0A6C0F9W1_9ZZZZ
MNVFVGTKTNPSFLVEINEKTIAIYQADRISKADTTLDFYETYALGKKVLETKYKLIQFPEKLPTEYKKASYGSVIVDTLEIITKKEKIVVQRSISIENL